MKTSERTNCGFGHIASVSFALTPNPFFAAASVLRISTWEGSWGAAILLVPLNCQAGLDQLIFL